MTQPDSHLEPAPSGGLMSTSFVGLLATQLLSVINDNVFRWLVIGIGKGLILNASNESAILMIGSNCFILPYLILAAPAGYLADRYSKRSVIVGCKAAELGIMLLGTIGVFFLDINVLFVAVALMGAQSALFSPAKLGSIPEMLQSKHISNANGLMGLSTVVATVIGMAIGNVLAEVTKEDSQYGWLIAGAVLLGLALVGWLTSLLIRKAPAANPTRRFPWDAPFQTYRDLKTLAMDRPMLRVSLGMMFFWSIGMLAQLNIDQFATEGGALVDTDKTPLLACLVAGLGIGSLLAGLWSGGRVELGILPLGAFGVAAFAMLLFTVQGDIFQAQAVTASFVLACVFLVGLGFSAGLFEVPLSSYMQHYSAAATRGSILAAMNFLVFGGMFMMSIVFWMLRMPLASGQPLFTANQIFLLSGLFTLPVFAYIIWLLPGATIRFVVWLASRTIYRVRTYQLENVPAEGGALLVPNHVSWVDGVMVGLAVDRPIRVVAFAGNFQSRFMKWLAELFGVILILPKPKMIVKALGTARKALEDGELVCIFAEGAITRTGQVQSFKPGMMKIIKGTDAPVIPVYLDELWGSIFSFNKGRFFWKWP
ncbi:MAG TPA: acyl-[ACP]--phospholipid O-acyltransferase, partial [Planctomycetaceae bacterium]|nr:acyl-[ACP]--phospholipid O-acyltransferase [Planctomycetaceae bacterium]